MRLIKDGHVVETTNAVEQVNLKGRGYVEVAEVAPVKTNTNKKETSDD